MFQVQEYIITSSKTQMLHFKNINIFGKKIYTSPNKNLSLFESPLELKNKVYTQHLDSSKEIYSDELKINLRQQKGGITASALSNGSGIWQDNYLVAGVLENNKVIKILDTLMELLVEYNIEENKNISDDLINYIFYFTNRNEKSEITPADNKLILHLKQTIMKQYGGQKLCSKIEVNTVKNISQKTLKTRFTGNLDNIDKLKLYCSVKWPEFTWVGPKGRLFQRFPDDISRVGYDKDGRIWAIICPQMGIYTGLGVINSEVTVTGVRGYVGKEKEPPQKLYFAGDMKIEVKVWLSPSALCSTCKNKSNKCFELQQPRGTLKELQMKKSNCKAANYIWCDNTPEFTDECKLLNKINNFFNEKNIPFPNSKKKRINY